MSGVKMRSSKADKGDAGESDKDSEPDTDQSADKNKNPFQEKAPTEALQRRVSLRTGSKLRLAILIASWVTIIVLLILGTITLALAIIEKISSAFAFSLDAYLDCLSSVVIIARYFRPESLYEARKESKACIVLGVLFIVSSASVIAKATMSILNREYPEINDILWYTALVSGVVCLALFLVKLYLARRLSSVSVATDAANSFIGMLLAFSTIISALTFQEQRKFWYIDAVFGYVCAIFLFVYGIVLIVVQSKVLTELNKCEEYEELKD